MTPPKPPVPRAHLTKEQYKDTKKRMIALLKRFDLTDREARVMFRHGVKGLGIEYEEANDINMMNEILDRMEVHSKSAKET